MEVDTDAGTTTTSEPDALMKWRKQVNGKKY